MKFGSPKKHNIFKILSRKISVLMCYYILRTTKNSHTVITSSNNAYMKKTLVDNTNFVFGPSSSEKNPSYVPVCQYVSDWCKLSALTLTQIVEFPSPVCDEPNRLT